MRPLDPLLGPVRSLLGVPERAETEVMLHSPLANMHALETRLDEAVTAVHRAAESMERHIEVLDTLAQSLAPLTLSVTRLTDQLGDLLKLTEPIAAAERDVSRFEHLFSRRGRRTTETQPPDH